LSRIKLRLQRDPVNNKEKLMKSIVAIGIVAFFVLVWSPAASFAQDKGPGRPPAKNPLRRILLIRAVPLHLPNARAPENRTAGTRPPGIGTMIPENLLRPLRSLRLPWFQRLLSISRAKPASLSKETRIQ